jgi:hypothetical protein
VPPVAAIVAGVTIVATGAASLTGPDAAGGAAITAAAINGLTGAPAAVDITVSLSTVATTGAAIIPTVAFVDNVAFAAAASVNVAAPAVSAKAERTALVSVLFVSASLSSVLTEEVETGESPPYV